MGLYLEAAATHSAASPGEKITIRIEAVNRSDAKARLESIRFSTGENWSGKGLTLANNEANFLEQTIKLPADMAYSSPYWLREPWETGRYTVPDQTLRGLPEAPPPVQAKDRKSTRLNQVTNTHLDTRLLL